MRVVVTLTFAARDRSRSLVQVQLSGSGFRLGLFRLHQPDSGQQTIASGKVSPAINLSLNQPECLYQITFSKFDACMEMLTNVPLFLIHRQVLQGSKNILGLPCVFAVNEQRY